LRYGALHSLFSVSLPRLPLQLARKDSNSSWWSTSRIRRYWINIYRCRSREEKELEERKNKNRRSHLEPSRALEYEGRWSARREKANCIQEKWVETNTIVGVRQCSWFSFRILLNVDDIRKSEKQNNFLGKHHIDSKKEEKKLACSLLHRILACPFFRIFIELVTILQPDTSDFWFHWLNCLRNKT
jgi:hypothetical protein